MERRPLDEKTVVVVVVGATVDVVVAPLVVVGFEVVEVVVGAIVGVAPVVVVGGRVTHTVVVVTVRCVVVVVGTLVDVVVVVGPPVDDVVVVVGPPVDDVVVVVPPEVVVVVVCPPTRGPRAPATSVVAPTIEKAARMTPRVTPKAPKGCWRESDRDGVVIIPNVSLGH